MDDLTKHKIKLNERMMEVETVLIEKAERIRKHLSAEIDAGNEDYCTFVIEGRICIEPCLQTPLDIMDKMDRLV